MLPPGSFSLATFWFDIHERSEKEPFKPPTNHPTHRDANAVRSLQLSRTLLIWNGVVKWGAAGEQLLMSPWWVDSRWAVGGGRAEVGQDRVGAAWIGGPPL